MPYKPKIVTRTLTTTTVTEDLIPKNAGLTNSELDSNFLNLRNQSFSIVGDDSTGIDIRSGDTIKLTGAGGATVTAVGDTITITAGGGGGSSIGDLSVVGSTILAPSNGDLGLQTSGTGYVHVKDKLAVAKEIYFDDYGAAEVEPPGNGSRMSILDDSIDINSGRASIDSFKIYSRAGTGSREFILDVNSTGDASDFGHFKIYGLSYPQSDGTAGQVLSTDGAGTLSFSGINKVGDLTVTNYTISSSGALFVLDAGSSNIKMTDFLDMDSNKITGLATPTVASDAATKLYVDKAALTYDPITFTSGSTTSALYRNNAGYYKITLENNGTISAFNNFSTGQTIVLLVIQDATGGRTLTFTPNIKWEGGSFPGLSTGANKRDIITIFHSGEADSDAYHASIRKDFA
jgi:hypothetical protein